jgi:transcriptional regulator with XRE-family HTH domain
MRPGVAPRGLGEGFPGEGGAGLGVEEASAIGARARRIRRRRGLSLEVVAGLAGISKQYLSALERGRRGFNRRGLIEDLASALGCSVADLTGQPYLRVDRQSADAVAAVAESALRCTTLPLTTYPIYRRARCPIWSLPPPSPTHTPMMRAMRWQVRAWVRC